MTPYLFTAFLVHTTGLLTTQLYFCLKWWKAFQGGIMRLWVKQRQWHKQGTLFCFHFTVAENLNEEKDVLISREDILTIREGMSDLLMVSQVELFCNSERVEIDRKSLFHIISREQPQIRQNKIIDMPGWKERDLGGKYKLRFPVQIVKKLSGIVSRKTSILEPLSELRPELRNSAQTMFHSSYLGIWSSWTTM